MGIKAAYQVGQIVEGSQQKNIPRTMRPGPCRLPARTRFGGLSTIDMKLGSSAGSAFARRAL
jgi:hypothetical protein